MYKSSSFFSTIYTNIQKRDVLIQSIFSVPLSLFIAVFFPWFIFICSYLSLKKEETRLRQIERERESRRKWDDSPSGVDKQNPFSNRRPTNGRLDASYMEGEDTTQDKRPYQPTYLQRYQLIQDGLDDGTCMTRFLSYLMSLLTLDIFVTVAITVLCGVFLLSIVGWNKFATVKNGDDYLGGGSYYEYFAREMDLGSVNGDDEAESDNNQKQLDLFLNWFVSDIPPLIKNKKYFKGYSDGLFMRLQLLQSLRNRSDGEVKWKENEEHMMKGERTYLEYVDMIEDDMIAYLLLTHSYISIFFIGYLVQICVLMPIFLVLGHIIVLVVICMSNEPNQYQYRRRNEDENSERDDNPFGSGKRREQSGWLPEDEANLHYCPQDFQSRRSCSPGVMEMSKPSPRSGVRNRDNQFTEPYSSPSMSYTNLSKGIVFFFFCILIYLLFRLFTFVLTVSTFIFTPFVLTIFTFIFTPFILTVSTFTFTPFILTISTFTFTPFVLTISTFTFTPFVLTIFTFILTVFTLTQYFSLLTIAFFIFALSSLS
jgi:hypothetical protein